MQTQEQQLIIDLSERLKQNPVVEKDKAAEVLIAEKIANQPDVLYKLVQAVLIQQLALQQAQQDITNLQGRVQDLERQSTQTSSGFLGGFAEKIFGTSNNQNASRTAAPSNSPPRQAGNPWQQQQNPYHQNPYMGAPMQGGAGSSFLANAASSAIGVAGGMALFHGMSNLFGSHASGGSTAASAGAAPAETTNITNNYYGDANQNASTDYGNNSADDYSDYDDFGGDDNF